MKQANPWRADVSLQEELRLIYEDFKTEVWTATQQAGSAGGLVAIPDLRRTLGGDLARGDFDAFVMRLHAEGHVHLMSHVDPESLAEQTIADCLCDHTGLLLYWLRWL